MALTLTIEKQSIAIDGSNFILENTTADYTNDGHIKTEYSEYFYVYKVDELAVRGLSIGVDNSMPDNTIGNKTWEVDTTVDGWYQGDLLVVKQWVDGPYDLSEVVSHNGLLYIATGPVILGNPAPGEVLAPWSEVLDYVTEILDVPVALASIDYLLTNQLHSAYVEACASNYLVDKVAASCFECKDCDLDVEEKIYYRLTALINAAVAEFWAGNYREMETIIQCVTNKCDEC